MHTLIGHDIEKAASFLQQGALVAIPTETVYGLAANALSEAAIIKIFEAKNRPRFNPLILHSHSIESLQLYADFSDKALSIAKSCMPGPLSLMLPKKLIVPDVLTAGSDKVVVRIPNHITTLSLLQSITFPLAAPSANPFGYISPTTAQHVYQKFEGKLPYILDGGESAVGVESTIAEVMHDHILIHRYGGMSMESLQEISGLDTILAPAHSATTSGKLKSHYAPGIPLYMGDVEQLSHQFQGKKIAAISFYNDYNYLASVESFILSPEKNMSIAAAKLFQTLRWIDAGAYDIILAEPFPGYGLGKAINDRLQRAQWIHK